MTCHQVKRKWKRWISSVPSKEDKSKCVDCLICWKVKVRDGVDMNGRACPYLFRSGGGILAAGGTLRWGPKVSVGLCFDYFFSFTLLAPLPLAVGAWWGVEVEQGTFWPQKLILEMIRMLWMGGWHCALTQQPPSKISIQFLLTKKATSFSPLDSFFPELRLLSSSFFSPPSFLMSWLFDKIRAAVAGCCFCFATAAAAQRGKRRHRPLHTARALFFKELLLAAAV